MYSVLINKCTKVLKVKVLNISINNIIFFLIITWPQKKIILILDKSADWLFSL